MLNENQLDALWSEYYPRVFGYFFKRVISYEDCEELASTSMSIFLTKIENGDLKLSAYYGYLWQIVRTQLVNYIRSKNSKPAIVTLLDNEEFEISDLEQQISSQYENLILSVFNQANHILSSEEFYLLQLSYQEGKNSTQISKDLNINASTVRKRISRIVTKLKTNLKPV
jgi:RNA polymerase sigma factor (sigma-70 family)